MRKKTMEFREALRSNKLYKRKNWKNWCYTQAVPDLMGDDLFVVDVKTEQEVELTNKDRGALDWIVKEDPYEKLMGRIYKKQDELDSLISKLKETPRRYKYRSPNESV